MNNYRNSYTGRHQRGVYTVVISMVLVAASMIAVRGLNKSSVLETRITSNHHMAREAAHAAEAALDYGITWYAMTDPAAWTLSGTVETATPTGSIPTVAASNGDTYNSTVTYTRDVGDREFLLVTATSVAAANSAVTATVQQYVHTNYLLVDPDFGSPPLMIDGCLTGVTGNPDIYPEANGTTAVATSEPPDCIDQGLLSYNSGAEVHNAFSGDIWNQLFELSRADMQAIADAEVAAGVPDSQRTVVWVTSTAPYHQSWGSATNPVILIFAPAANCPMVNGSPTHYGVIFVDGDCTGAHGWGGTTVFGTVAINGDIGKYNSNTELTHWGLVANSNAYNLKNGVAPRIPGSWRDF